MTEGIVMVEGALAVLFESAADKYRRTSRFPQDRIHFLDTEKLIYSLPTPVSGAWIKD
ncbi:MAG: hypothetical protein LC660_18430 [Desulfobacteraceae bacterium]|nr:hypothetical protein [Desulfobacteraceae bacterium]